MVSLERATAAKDSIYWLPPDVSLKVPGETGSEVREFSLQCSKKEHYERFPFTVAVTTPAGVHRFTFSASSEVHEVKLPLTGGATIRIQSESSFNPSSAGLTGTSHHEAGVAILGWKGSFPVESVCVSTSRETVVCQVQDTVTVGVDVRTLAYFETRERGIGHYTFNHLAEVLRQCKDWNFILYTDEDEGETSDPLQTLLALPNARRGVMGDQQRDDLSLYHIADPMTILPGFDSPFLARPNVPTTAVFYDLIPLVKREMHFDCWEGWSKRSYMRRLAEMDRSNTIALSISESSRQDLHRLTGFPLERCVTIMAGFNRSSSDNPSAAELERVKRKFGLHAPFFMSVGGLDGHKGFLATARAYAAVRSVREIQFVAAGSLKDPYKESYRKLFEANGIPGVLFPGYVSQDEMACLYALASALVFPSHYEGFGFPVLEAMAYGCPVITTNVSSLPEVAGDAGIIVEVDDAQGIERAMKQLLDEPRWRSELAARGVRQAGKFSWERTARATIAVWHEMLGCQEPLPRTTKGAPFQSGDWK